MKRILPSLVIVYVWLAASGPVRLAGRASATAAQAEHGVEVNVSVHHDVSPPLRTVPPRAPAAQAHIRQVLPIPHAVVPEQPDPAVQTTIASQLATTAGLSFAGVGNGDYGFAPN